MEKEVIIRVQDNPDYIKDQGTGAILNTNVAKLKEYKLRKKQSTKIQNLQEEVEQLKDMVRALLEGQKCQ
ncbi:hypothetical protein OAU13_00010 [bacterium]|nr:hypothetical protein [bacterium]